MTPNKCMKQERKKSLFWSEKTAIIPTKNSKDLPPFIFQKPAKSVFFFHISLISDRKRQRTTRLGITY